MSETAAPHRDEAIPFQSARAQAQKEKLAFEPKIQELKNRLLEMHQKVSQKRKAGGYVGVAALMLMNIPAKIKLIEIDPSDRDIERVNEVFKAVEDDLKTEYP